MRTTIQVLQPKKRAVKTPIFCLVILLFVFTSQAKMFSYLNYTNDAIAVYQTAFNYIVVGRSSSQKIKIQKQTSLSVIKKFNFKHPSYNVLDTLGFKLKEPWGKFLISIDTAHLKNSIINIEKIKISTLSSNSDKPNAIITFSPIIISSNNTLAVCAYQYTDNFENNVLGILLLEKTVKLLASI